MRNYIGREGVLKTGHRRLVLDSQQFSLWKKRALIGPFWDPQTTPAVTHNLSSGGRRCGCGKAALQRNPSRKLLIRLLKSGSRLRRSSTLRIEWMTVE